LYKHKTLRVSIRACRRISTYHTYLFLATVHPLAPPLSPTPENQPGCA
jgi:hypothetical protein